VQDRGNDPIRSWRLTFAYTGSMSTDARIGVVGATGAVGTVTLQLLAERGYENVRAFASSRSAGSTLSYGEDALTVEEATPDALSGDLDLCLFSVGTAASRALVPRAASGGAICVDKSSAYRLVEGYPLVVPEVNGARALEALERDRIVANPNCCTIPLTCVLKPLHDAAGLRSVHVATYQSVSGAGAQRMAELEAEAPADHNLLMDWSWVGDESDEESKLVAETKKILELPELPVSATCVRVPVLVGHSEAIWAEFDAPLTAEDAAEILSESPSVRVLELPEFPTPKDATGIDEVLVGRIRADRARENGLALFLASDNLRKGAALNAIQIAELLLAGVAA
jgi:aspartate-semialdehyde dehydrogenase